MILYALLGLTQTDPSAVIARFERYMASAKTLSVAITGTVNGLPLGQGYLRLARPNRLSFSTKGPGIDATYVQNETGAVDLERVGRFYDQFGPMKRWFVPPSRLSLPVFYGIPRFLLDGNLTHVGGKEAKGVKFKLTPKQMVGSVSTDLVTVSNAEDGATFVLKAWIDAAGRIVKFYRKADTIQGTSIITYELSGYNLNPVFPANAFSTQVPSGFSPYELASADNAIEAGRALPMGSYVNASTNRSVSLKSLTEGKNALILVADPQYPANGALLKSVRALAKRVPNSTLVVVGNGKSAQSAKAIASDTLFDPTGRELEKLALPGAPMLYLLNKKGFVVQAFFGFDGRWAGLDDAVKRLK